MKKWILYSMLVFLKKMITVLPDHTPINLYVHPFQGAHNLLLLKPDKRMQQLKHSLPNVHNPFNFIKNPPVNTITELHHGSGWVDSWRDVNCDLEKNEMLVPISYLLHGLHLSLHP